MVAVSAQAIALAVSNGHNEAEACMLMGPSEISQILNLHWVEFAEALSDSRGLDPKGISGPHDDAGASSGDETWT
jgi:hypothetical protein